MILRWKQTSAVLSQTNSQRKGWNERLSANERDTPGENLHPHDFWLPLQSVGVSNFPFKLNEPSRRFLLVARALSHELFFVCCSQATSFHRRINKHENNLIMFITFWSLARIFPRPEFSEIFELWRWFLFISVLPSRFKYSATILSCIRISPMPCFELKELWLFRCFSR